MKQFFKVLANIDDDIMLLVFLAVFFQLIGCVFIYDLFFNDPINHAFAVQSTVCMNMLSFSIFFVATFVLVSEYKITKEEMKLKK